MSNPERWYVTRSALSFQKDKGALLVLTAQPLRATIACWTGDLLFGLITAVTWEWTFQVGIGKRDAYGLLPWSVGHGLFTVAQWAGRGFGLLKLEKEIAELPLTQDQVKQYFPDDHWLLED